MALSAAEIAPGIREVINDKFVVGVDLGQSMDPTAICVLQHRTISHLTFKGHLRQVGETFDVRHLQRLPLGLSYPEQVDAVAQLLARPPLGKAELVIDETGVGRAVGDLFETARMQPTRVTITAGMDASWVGPRRHHVPKTVLISALDARLHTGELRFAADLHEAGAMADELKDFRRKVSVAGRTHTSPAQANTTTWFWPWRLRCGLPLRCPSLLSPRADSIVT
jgi:hypothetical protein